MWETKYKRIYLKGLWTKTKDHNKTPDINVVNWFEKHALLLKVYYQYLRDVFDISVL